MVTALLCGLLVALFASALAANGPPHLAPIREAARMLAPLPRPARAEPTTMPAAPAIAFAMRDFETGIAFPRWNSTGYGAADAGWGAGLDEIQQQTGAGWVEMLVQFYQDAQGSTYVHTGPATPTPASLAAGIRTAHGMGLHVFVVPLLGVLHGQPWGGAIHFASGRQVQAWFASYWRALEPYMAAAADAGAEQFAIGTELSAMERAGSGLWYSLIASARATFPGTLTYDMNWSSLGDEPRAWMRDPRLAYLGVSEYAPLAAGPWRLSAEQIAGVWGQRFLPGLDALSRAAGKPVILSEIGYRDTRDALYHPWDHASRAPHDPELQASAYTQALRAVYAAPSVAGIFFWAWSVDQFAPNGQPAAQVLRTYYRYYQAVARRATPHHRDPFE
jgi:hypothetical protein